MRSYLPGLTAFVLSATAVFALSAMAQSFEVHQKGRRFDPTAMTIKAGQTVTFTNDDTVTHNILVRELGFNSGSQEVGRNVQVTFTDPGVFQVRCGIHPQMRLTVTVER